MEQQGRAIWACSLRFGTGVEKHDGGRLEKVSPGNRALSAAGVGGGGSHHNNNARAGNNRGDVGQLLYVCLLHLPVSYQQQQVCRGLTRRGHGRHPTSAFAPAHAQASCSLNHGRGLLPVISLQLHADAMENRSVCVLVMMVQVQERSSIHAMPRSPASASRNALEAFATDRPARWSMAGRAHRSVAVGLGPSLVPDTDGGAGRRARMMSAGGRARSKASSTHLQPDQLPCSVPNARPPPDLPFRPGLPAQARSGACLNCLRSPRAAPPGFFCPFVSFRRWTVPRLVVVRRCC